MKKIALLAASLLLNGCVVHDIPELLPPITVLPQWITGIDYPAGEPLSSGDNTRLHFFTSEPNFHTDIGLASGATYALKVELLSNWSDATIDENELGHALDEKGFDNSVMPFEWLGNVRRSTEHNWFELMLFQRNCKESSMQGISDLTFNQETKSYEFTASCNGALSLFVNDTRGFYGNNTGYANLSVSRLN